MAYDEQLADRVRTALAGQGGLSEKAMFGGLAFMVSGHMACGVVKDELMVRLGPDGAERALSRDHVRRMDFTGRPMKGMVFVEPRGLRDDEALRGWVSDAASFAASLPPQ
jgi:TfoX/Sxy family transcriptional regulator of competence genes